MKHLFRSLIVCVLAVAILATATGFAAPTQLSLEAAESEVPEPGSITPLETIDADVLGLDVGGVSQTYGEAICECIRRSFPGSNSNYQTGSMFADIRMVAAGLGQMSYTESASLFLAMNGEDPFTEPLDNIRSLGYMMEMYYTFVADAALGVTTIDEVCEKINDGEKITYGLQPLNSTMEMIGTAIMNEYGITEETQKDAGTPITYCTTGNGVSLMQDGNIQVYSTLSNLPTARFVELGGTKDITLLGLSDDLREYLINRFGLVDTVIPKDTYSFQTEDVPTVKCRTYLYTNAEMSNEMAYSICKALYDNLEYYNSATGQEITAEEVATYAKESGIPLHPGAEAFYREMGLLDDAPETEEAP